MSLSIDLHTVSVSQTGERAIAGVTHGLIGPGETVTWQGRHFGFELKHETLIAQYDRPRHFQDVMLKGMFQTFEHDHYFETETPEVTRMRDELRFTAPFGPLGLIAETLVLRRYLRNFLVERNEIIRKIAESDQKIWAPFLNGE